MPKLCAEVPEVWQLIYAVMLEMLSQSKFDCAHSNIVGSEAALG